MACEGVELLRAGGAAACIDQDVRCLVRDYEGEQEFERRLQENEHRMREADNLFTYTDEYRIGKGRAGAVRAPRGKRVVVAASDDGSAPPIARVDAGAFAHKVLDPGVAPTLSTTLSKSLRDNRPPSGSTRLQPVVGARTVVVSDTDLRASKYQVSE